MAKKERLKSQILRDALIKNWSNFNKDINFCLKYLEARDNPTEDNLIFRKAMEGHFFPALIDRIKADVKLEGIEKGLSLKDIEEMQEKVADQVNPSEEYRLKIRAGIDIGCPVCKTKLVFVKKEAYETLVEHVCEPKYVSKKDAFGCPNPDCDVHKKGILWLGNGEGPYGDTYATDVKYIDNNKYPFRTYNRQHEAEKEIELNFFKIKDKNGSHGVIIYYSFKADMNGNKKWWTLHLKFQPIIKGCFYTPGIVLLYKGLHYYARFKTERISNFKQHIDRVCSWDDRWWSRIELKIAKFLWRKDYKQAIKNII